jgi:hypothetical protein
MPRYEIEQYEIHTVKFEVDAKNEAEAIAKVFGGQASPIDNSDELIEVCEDLGMPVDLHRSLTKRLRKIGVAIGDDVIPSIRSVEKTS